jgi:hypothetical protein
VPIGEEEKTPAARTVHRHSRDGRMTACAVLARQRTEIVPRPGGRAQEWRIYSVDACTTNCRLPFKALDFLVAPACAGASRSFWR